LIVENCAFSDDVLYDLENFVWVKKSEDSFFVGVTSITVWNTGIIKSVSLKPVGTSVDKGKLIGSLEGPKNFVVVKAPFSGSVKEVNSNVLQKPRMINDDPYGAGWLVKMTPSDPNQVALLKSAQEAKEAFSKKIKDLRIRCYAAFPDVELYEIGIECSAVLAKLNDALSRLSVGSVVLLVTDDPTSEIEMMRWAKQTGQQLLEKRRNDNLYHFIVKKVV